MTHGTGQGITVSDRKPEAAAYDVPMPPANTILDVAERKALKVTQSHALRGVAVCNLITIEIVKVLLGKLPVDVRALNVQHGPVVRWE